MAKIHMVLQFLSCLFGSEAPIPLSLALDDFLSCLFGSEGRSGREGGADPFLSCLFGSEVGAIAGKLASLKVWRDSVVVDHFFSSSGNSLIFKRRFVRRRKMGMGMPCRC